MVQFWLALRVRSTALDLSFAAVSTTINLKVRDPLINHFVFVPGEFGEVRYTLSGDLASLFKIDPLTGVITVAPDADIDREATSDIYLRAIASDNAPAHVRRSTSVPVSVM